MLTTKPPSISYQIYLHSEDNLALIPPAVSGTPPKRKRGAQPGNQNARKYQVLNAGAFFTGAIKAREVSYPTIANPDTCTGSSYARASGPTFIDLDRRLRRSQRAGLAEDIREFTEYSQILGDHFDQALLTGQHRAAKRIFKCLITCATSIEKFADLSIRLTWQERTLARCADHAHLARIRKNPALHIFKHSFLGNSDTLSTYAAQPECPVSFLNDRQWLLIQPLLTAQLADDQAAALQKRDPAKKQRASRAIPWPARFLLDAILWKLATACTWSELPRPYPLRRCQILYRSLEKSGRLGHLVTLLHEDFIEYCQHSLRYTALNGEYYVWGSKILYIPRHKHNWQGLVSLLLLQVTRRVLLREQRHRRTFCLDERRLPRQRGFPTIQGLLKKYIRYHKLLIPGTLRIPPPHNHPSLKNLPHMKCHPPASTPAMSPARRAKGGRSQRSDTYTETQRRKGSLRASAHPMATRHRRDASTKRTASACQA